MRSPALHAMRPPLRQHSLDITYYSIPQRTTQAARRALVEALRAGDYRRALGAAESGERRVE